MEEAPRTAELLLYGEIGQETWWGDEATPRQFADELGALGNVENIVVRINSSGGDVFAAQAIGNLLEQCSAKVTAHIDGICASAATIVACHCEKTEAANDATYMIHPVKMGISDYLDATQLAQYINAITAIRENIVTLYAKKTCRDKDEVAALMDATTWWTAEQAKENGFVDALVDEPVQMENRNGALFINSIATNVPVSAAPKFVQDSLKAAPAADCFVNKNPAQMPENNSHKEDNEMANATDNTAQNIATVDDLRKAYPELMNAAAAEQKTALTAAQKAERERLKAIDEVAGMLPAELVNEAKYGENPCNAQELTYRAALDAKKHGRAFIDALTDDAKNSGADGVPAAAPADAVDESKLTSEQKQDKARNTVKALFGKKEG